MTIMTAHARIAGIPEDYLALVAKYPLRPIRSDGELAAAMKVVDRLAVLDHRTEDQEDYLDVLSGLIEEYESERYEAKMPKKGTLSVLRFLLDENGMSGSDLGRLLGQRQLGAAILAGRRQLSKNHIAKLAQRFKVNPRLFLR
jgi:HTH-type transcriptional regulator/antitoxin HigA